MDDNAEEDRLLPCPRCGSKNVEDKSETDFIDNYITITSVWVECNDCGFTSMAYDESDGLHFCQYAVWDWNAKAR